jgi:GT2 family glycosyltransferase
MEETDDDYVWLMDDDTVPTPSALTELLKGAKKVNNQFGFLASDVRWTDNTRMITVFSSIYLLFGTIFKPFMGNSSSK